MRYPIAGLGLGFFLFCFGCGEPLVPRTPEQLYRLAAEQLRNENYVRALDTLARITRTSPNSPLAVKAALTRMAVLAGWAHGAHELGEIYLQASEQATEPAAKSTLRQAGMEQFSIAQSHALALLDALAGELPGLAGTGWSTDPLLPLIPPAAHPALARLRAGQPLGEAERTAIQRDAIRRGLAEMMAALAGTPGDFGRAHERLARDNARLERAGVYLAFGDVLVSLSRLFDKTALDNPRYHRLFHERALALAERAWANAAADSARAQAAERLRLHCQRVLAGR